MTVHLLHLQEAFYTNECTITTDKGSYATTENITYDKLLNSGLY